MRNSPQADVHPPQADQYSVVEFHIYTGDDDLRINSIARTEMNFADTSTEKCSFKDNGDDAWGNNSDNTIECHLDRARTYDELRKARIWIIKQDVVNFLWGSDNWNVDKVIVTGKDPDNHASTCIWSSSGNPLIRLTGKAPKFAVEDYDTSC